MTFPYIWPVPAISGICFLIALLSKRRPEDRAKALGGASSGARTTPAPLPARPGSAPLPAGARPKVALYTRSGSTESAVSAAVSTAVVVARDAVVPEPPPAEVSASDAVLAPQPLEIEITETTEPPAAPEHGHVASGSFATRPDVVGMVYEEMHTNGQSTNGRVAEVARAAAPSVPSVVSANIRDQAGTATVDEVDDEAPGFLGFSTMELGDTVVPAGSVPDAFAGLLTPQAAAALRPDDLQPELDDDMPAIWPRAIVGNRDVAAPERLKILRQLAATKDMVSGLILTEAYAEERDPELREAALRALRTGLHADARHSFLEAINSKSSAEQQLGVEGLAALEDLDGLEAALTFCGPTAATLAAVALFEIEDAPDPRAYLSEFTADESVISRALMLRRAAEQTA